MIAPAAGLDHMPLKPGSVSHPLPGIDIGVVDKDGNEVNAGEKGFLVIKRPWPGILMGIHNDPERYEKVYWSKFKDSYYSGDLVEKDEDGYFWLKGRADDTLKVAGHLVDTAEVENAVVTTEGVVEAAVVGVSDELKGAAIALFVILKQGVIAGDDVRKLIKQNVRKLVGPHTTPRDIYFLDKLPKTRSGKIMRRVLKALVQGLAVGDVSTIEDESSIKEAKEAYDEFHGVIRNAKENIKTF